MPRLPAIGCFKQRGVFDPGVHRVRVAQRWLEMPHALELPRMRGAVVPLMGSRHAFLSKFVADGVPRLSAIARSLHHLAVPAGRLGCINAIWIDPRPFQVINLPTREMRAGNIPSRPLAISRQNKCALAGTAQHANSAHDCSLSISARLVRRKNRTQDYQRRLPMRFMMIVKASKESEAGAMPEEKILADMAKYNEELVKAGVMLDGSGLKPSSKSARVKYSGSKRTVIDGPFAEAKELIAGYWIIQVKSKEEAVEWAKRVPFHDGEVELRPFFELEDFAPGPAIEHHKELDKQLKNQKS